jgi:hypothetical protein
MSKRYNIFTILLLVATPFLSARAQTASDTIAVPPTFMTGVWQIVNNLFATSSLGGIVAEFVGVILALIALEFLISALIKR